ncbi:MAG: FAD-dependent oxidoreductase [Acidobacteria bacterium]|nr:FAD-dependent oxidoreductase [Acidobacteriota bacterium]
MPHTSIDPGRATHGGALTEGRDFPLGLPGFCYSDLHDARRLADLHQEFDRALLAADPDLHTSFVSYRRDPGSLGPVETSDLLIRIAGHVGRFIARLFRIEENMRRAAEEARAQEPIFTFKRDFLQRRAFRKFRPGQRPAEEFAILDGRVRALFRHVFQEIDLAADPELATARLVVDLMALEGDLAAVVRLKRASEVSPASARRMAAIRARLQARPDLLPGPRADGVEGDLDIVERILSLLEDWSFARFHDPAGRAEVRSWVSYRFPEDLDYGRLVEIDRFNADMPEMLRGPSARRRRRDGFKLTDPRMTPRQVLDEAHYCVLCHERDKDSCSKGLRAKEGAFRRNPLGIVLKGCPLDEKISEMHLLQRQGDSLAALAIVCLDNPMCPGTGHRICNDCMKGCIFQKQEPVNIPQIETGILTDVLSFPYGFEIWSLLTRWNPLNVRRPYPLPYNGRNVLVVGLGPAGYTLAHFLVNEGFGVVGIDGLKIEPLPGDLTGADGLPPLPVQDVRELTRDLDDRPLAGFGGVAEYGITVRWDKNFLTLIHLCLARRRKARFYGGVRFGGTLTAEQAWDLGFDHIAIAAGAGKPTIIDMKNNLINGIRKASDFLMALQLTGAFKRNALANLEARVPAVVIGGGLTAIDSATELLAYYPAQVEKVLERYEALARETGEDRIRSIYTPEEGERLREYLAHGRAVRQERERARRAGEAPDFASLVESWGGVSIVYRKSLVDSPAYRLNHEEVVKALEEGIRFVECLDPEEAVPDRHGSVRAVVFRRMRQEGSRWVDSGERVRLPARTVLVAAGTSPNVTYEREHAGSFDLDERRLFFRSHRAERGPDGALRLRTVKPEEETGFFTSYNRDGRLISYFGDNHPEYAGNVVRAMASAREGFRRIAELFPETAGGLYPGDQPARDARLRDLFRTLDDRLRARVVEVNRLTPTIIEVVVRAPQAARNFRPGQFFRLQNFEATAPRPLGHPLLMEPLALTGAWVDRERGLLSLIAIEIGASSRLCAVLKENEEVVVMGPTGAPTEIPPGSTLLLAGGGLGNAVLFSIAREAKERGCRVIYFAGYKKREDLFKREEIEKGCDVVVWSVDAGEPIPPRRAQDRTFVGNIVQAMAAYGRGDLGEGPIRLQDADRVIAIGSDRMMAAVARARHEVLKPFLKPDHVGIASINSPMQCMMKQVCAQCLQKHVDPATGRESGVVFSCFNQDQPLDCVDWAHLRLRLSQNTVQEKLAGLWLDHLLAQSPLTAR